MDQTESSPEFAQALRYLKALADQSRLRLLGLLAVRERSVEELAELLRLKAPTASHHLTILRELNLVRMHAEGNTHLYQLNEPGLSAINKLLGSPERLVALAPIEDGDAWERKALRDFLVGERLKEIPASLKKRLVILRWLAGRFEVGRRYSEPEVNDLLKRSHEDSATLRRELVGNGLMRREQGIYWRTEA